MLARAVSGVLSAAVALLDPVVVLIGGRWGRHPKILTAVERECARTPRPVPIEPATIDNEPALAGAREAALEQLRGAIVAAASRQPGLEILPT